MGQFGALKSDSSYNLNADVLMFDARWEFTERGEIYLTGSWTTTDAGFNSITLIAHDDVPMESFPDGLPGPGDDPTAPLHFHDYDFSGINEYSDLAYDEMRATLGFTYKTKEAIGFYGALSLYDFSDDDPYIQSGTGSVTVINGGMTWSF